MPWNATLEKKPRRIEEQQAEDGEIIPAFWVVDYAALVWLGPNLIRFGITYRRVKGGGYHIRFCDKRETAFGASGTEGRWGTRPPEKHGNSRSLTPAAWKSEVSRLIGADRADGVIQDLLDALEQAEARRIERRLRMGATKQPKRTR